MVWFFIIVRRTRKMRRLPGATLLRCVGPKGGVGAKDGVGAKEGGGGKDGGGAKDVEGGKGGIRAMYGIAGKNGPVV